MNERSLQATKDGIDKAIRSITDKGWSRGDLANKVVIGDKTGISSQPIHHFFAGRSVDRLYFGGICRVLGLDWEEICGLEPKPIESEDNESGPTPIDLTENTSRSEYLKAIQFARQRVWIYQTWLPGIELESNQLCNSEATDIRLVLLSFKEGSPVYARLSGRGMSVDRGMVQKRPI